MHDAAIVELSEKKKGSSTANEFRTKLVSPVFHYPEIIMSSLTSVSFSLLK